LVIAALDTRPRDNDNAKKKERESPSPGSYSQLVWLSSLRLTADCRVS